MPDTNSASLQNISATTAAFNLRGGKFLLDAHATWSAGNIVLQKLAADGSTYVPVGSQITADGAQNYDLPPGSYKIALTTATGVYVQIVRVPQSSDR